MRTSRSSGPGGQHANVTASRVEAVFDIEASRSLDEARRVRLIERLAVSWEIAGLPLDDQKMLLGRYRMADADTRGWVRRTIAAHLERHIPELAG